MSAADFKTEFPGFDPATMPPLPEGFVDISWHNDACPSFMDPKTRLRLFVDYADPAEREMTRGFRFSLHTCDKDGDCLQPVIDSDDWGDIAAAIEKARAAQFVIWCKAGLWCTAARENLARSEIVDASLETIEADIAAKGFCLTWCDVEPVAVFGGYPEDKEPDEVLAWLDQEPGK
ncbi:hypothetical protein GOC60_17130 [Sinorhizobium meliloti]|nr:hypothetical protein [Sinorhizobium meliloti]MDX0350188.1 hypothetical protein [Sinorhizobium meliloti]